MITRHDESKPRPSTEDRGTRPFSVKVLRSILLGLLSIFAMLIAFLAFSGRFTDYYEPVQFSSYPSGSLTGAPLISPYWSKSDSLGEAINDVSSNGGKSLQLRIDNGPSSFCGVTLNMKHPIPPDASLKIRWRGDKETYLILIDLTISDPNGKIDSVGTNYYVYADAPHEKWSTISIPFNKFRLNPAQRPGARLDRAFNSAGITGVSLTFFPGIKATLQIESLRFVWGTAEWSFIILIVVILVFGFVLWSRTTARNILFQEKLDLRSSTVYARVAFILLVFSLIAGMMSSDYNFFSTRSLVVYTLFFLSIVADEFFKDILSDKPLLTLRYGIILAVGWYFSFTLNPAQLMFLLAIVLIPIAAYNSRLLLIGLPALAFVVLVIRPRLNVHDTIVPGSIIIASLAFIAAFVREMLEHKEAQKDASYALSLYGEMLEKTSDAVFVTDTSGIVESVNSGFKLLTGYESKEVIGKRIDDFVHPEDVKLLPQDGSRGLTEVARNYDLRFITRKREVRSALLREAMLFKDERHTGYHWVATDISERKRAEEALRESEDKYKTLFTSSPEAIFIIGLDGKVLDCNPPAEKILGMKKEEIVGTSFREQNFSFLGRSVVQLEKAFGEILAEGHVAPSEIEVRWNDKAVFWFSISASLLKKNGTAYAIQAIVSNMTKRKKVEESIRRLNAFNEMLLKTLPFGISVVDEQGRILFMSEKLKEDFDTDVIGKQCWTAYKDDSKQCGDCPLKAGIEIGRTEVLESTGVLGGRTFQISHTGLMYGDKKAILEIFQDVTENKKLQSQFIQAQKMESLGTLASGIAHDFNNILGIILGHSALIEAKLSGSDELSRSFSAITRAAGRGASLVRQMLTFARKSDVSFMPLSVNDSVMEIQKLFYETFPKTMTLSCELSDNLPLISGNSTQLHQVLLNLCVNARDAMSGNGTLTVSTSLVSGESIRGRFLRAVFSQYVLLEVHDTGVGMDEKTRQHIFEPFFTTKELGKGTGLGLAVVFGIMEDHEGFIDVQSEVGRGTTFHLYFPVKSPPMEAHERSAPEDEAPGGNETILVVEDEEMLRELAADILSMKGYKVLTAVDGEDGVEVFRAHSDEIALVVSDLGLPKLTGKEVLKKIKTIKPSAKFILATGFIDPEERSEILGYGASDVVSKPYSPNNLSRTVRDALDA